MPPKTHEANTPRKESQQNKNSPPSLRNPRDENATEEIKNVFPDKNIVSCLIHWAVRMLHEHGIDSPRLDAEIILSHLLNCRRIDLYIHPDKPVELHEVISYQKAIQRRAQRVPLQYITHHAEFVSLNFYVDERVLIPRPETELVVEAVIKRSQFLPKETEIIIVDIGVGSGNIAVTLAKKSDNARIFAIDISPDALAVARINAQRHGVLDKITFLCGDTFQPLAGYGIESKVHFIVSNPPYISSAEFGDLQREVKDHEPYIALVSGQDGYQMFKHIIADAHAWLKPGGFIIFEVGEKQAQPVARLLEDTGYFKKTNLIKDHQHIYRIVISQMEKTCG